MLKSTFGGFTMILSLLEILFSHLCLFLIINRCNMLHKGYCWGIQENPSPSKRSDKVLETCFQGQETHDFRKPGTREASDSRMHKIRGSWFGEEVESRTCGSPESRAGDGVNFGRWPIRESVRDPVRESRAGTCTNLRRSES
jgi:hypothetical protein